MKNNTGLFARLKAQFPAVLATVVLFAVISGAMYLAARIVPPPAAQKITATAAPSAAQGVFVSTPAPFNSGSINWVTSYNFGPGTDPVEAVWSYSHPDCQS